MLKTQDRDAPGPAPNSGINQAAKSEKVETEPDPSIIGPTAPLGTAAPCESHSPAMVVMKMAGNTAAMPATREPTPCSGAMRAMSTLVPIAAAVSSPLAKITGTLTLRLPLGAGLGVQVAAKPAPRVNTVAATPNQKGRIPSCEATSTRLTPKNAMTAHALSDRNSMSPNRLANEP